VDHAARLASGIVVMTELVVWFGDRIVGRLEMTEPGMIRLTYATRWLDDNAGFPISISLPLRAEPFLEEATTYFANLLPEGDARAAVCAKLGISLANDVALLRALGGECAGALMLLEPGRRPPDPQLYSYELIDDRRLRALVKHEVVPLLSAGATTRLSLAGAQDKLPVALLDGDLHLALEGAPSTHILKLPHPHLPHLPINEGFVMGLARAIGLDVPMTEVLTRTDPPSLLVERYDRIHGDEITRLHQEDLCQALALPASQKYEQEGGPSVARAIEVVTMHAQRPIVDTRRVIEWQAFNVVAGNCDGHGKNLSLLYTGRTLRLAPFYDLVSTRHYPRLDRNLAMSVGGRREPTELHTAQWRQVAVDVGLGAKIVLDAVRGVAERVLEVSPAWLTEYRRRVGRRAILQSLPTEITKNAKRVLRQLT
jgi:serine/threonine-protein kinase HipA